jgi:hypothetical protein
MGQSKPYFGGHFAELAVECHDDSGKTIALFGVTKGCPIAQAAKEIGDLPRRLSFVMSPGAPKKNQKNGFGQLTRSIGGLRYRSRHARALK